VGQGFLGEKDEKRSQTPLLPVLEPNPRWDAPNHPRNRYFAGFRWRPNFGSHFGDLWANFGPKFEKLVFWSQLGAQFRFLTHNRHFVVFTNFSPKFVGQNGHFWGQKDRSLNPHLPQIYYVHVLGAVLDQFGKRPHFGVNFGANFGSNFNFVITDILSVLLLFRMKSRSMVTVLSIYRRP